MHVCANAGDGVCLVVYTIEAAVKAAGLGVCTYMSTSKLDVNIWDGKHDSGPCIVSPLENTQTYVYVNLK